MSFLITQDPAERATPKTDQAFSSKGLAQSQKRTAELEDIASSIRPMMNATVDAEPSEPSVRTVTYVFGVLAFLLFHYRIRKICCGPNSRAEVTSKVVTAAQRLLT